VGDVPTAATIGAAPSCRSTTAPYPVAPPGYAIEAELGRGGMGVVYLARQHGLNRPVAVKMILAGEHAEPRELVRFLAEAEAVAAVRHPNVVQVFEFGEFAGRPFIVLEFCSGGSLAAAMKERSAFPPEEAARLVAKLARGVAAAHDLAIVHRDLKPQNVLLDASGEPKVTDFGLAKRGTQADLTRTGAVMGTPAYMAPEQAAGRTKFVGPTADVYALGVILFELLTGRVPFTAEETVALIMKVVNEEPPSPRALNPAVPRDLAVVCLKCLAKEPTRRYATAGGLVDDLDRFLRREPVEARPVSQLERLFKWCRRNRGLALVSAVALGALLIGTAVSVWQAVRAVDAEQQAQERAAAAQIARDDANREKATAVGESQRADANLRDAQRLTASLALDRGLGLCEAGEVDRGLLWLARGLESVPPGDIELDRTIRLSLAAWQPAAPAQVFAADLTTAPWTKLGPAVAGRAAGVIAFSRDGTRAAFPAGADTFTLWDAVAMRPVGTLPHTYSPEVPAPVFSPDGSRLVCLDGGSARLHAAADGRQLSDQLGVPDGPATRPRFSPDGRALVLSARSGVNDVRGAWLFDVATGASRGAVPGVPLPVQMTAVIGPNGRYALAICQGGRFVIRDTVTGAAIENAVTRKLWPFINGFFLGDGTRFGLVLPAVPSRVPAPGSGGSPEPTGAPPRFQIVDLIAGKELGPPASFPFGNKQNPVQFASGGSNARYFVFWSGPSAFQVWDVAAIKPVVTGELPGFNAVRSYASPDGKHFLAVGESSFRVWSLSTGRPTGDPVPVPLSLRCEFRFVAGGRSVFVRHAGGKQELYEPATGRKRDGLIPDFKPDAFGRWAFVGDELLCAEGGVLRAFDLATGRPKGKAHVPGPGVRVTALNPTEKWVLLTVTGEGWVGAQVWDPVLGKPASPVIRTDAMSATLSPDGRRLCAGTRVWDLATGKLLSAAILPPRLGPPAWSTVITRGPQLTNDGRVATLLETETIRFPVGWVRELEHSWVALVDMETGRLIGHVPHLPVAFGPNGTRGWVYQLVHDSTKLVTQSSAGAVRVWDPATGKPLTPPLPHGTFVREVVLSPAARRLITVGDDHTARLWNADTGRSLGEPVPIDRAEFHWADFVGKDRVLLHVPGPARQLLNAETGAPVGEPIRFVNLPPVVAGTRLLVREGLESARLLDLETGSPVSEPLIGYGPPDWIEFASGGEVIWSGGGRSVRPYRVRDLAPVGPPLTYTNVILGAPAQKYRFSPDTKELVVLDGDGVYRIDAATGISHGPPVGLTGAGITGAVRLEYPAAGAVGVVTFDGSLYAFDPVNGKALGPPVRQAGRVGSSLPVLSPAGDRALIRAGGDDLAGPSRQVLLSTGQVIGGPVAPPERGSWEGKHWTDELEGGYTPDGRLVWSRSGPHVYVARADTGERLGDGVRTESTPSASGSYLVLAGLDGAVRIYDSTAPGPPVLHRVHGSIAAARLGPDGRTLIVVTEDGHGAVAPTGPTGSGREVRARVRIWRLPGVGGAAALFPSGRDLFLAFDTGGRYLSVFGAARTRAGECLCRTWDRTTGRPVLQHHELGGAGAVAVRPDGGLVAAGVRITPENADPRAGVALIDPSSGRTVREVSAPGQVLALQFSPDGQTLLLGGGGGARHVRVSDGSAVGAPLDHPTVVLVALIAPDGKTLFTGGEDGTGRFWDAATGKLLAEVKVDGMILSASFSPDGKRVVTGSGHPFGVGSGRSAARLWNAATGKLIGEAMVHPGAVVATAVSPDGTLILTGDTEGTARVWTANTGRPVGESLAHEKPLQSVAFHPSGRTYLTAGDDGTVRQWRTVDRAPVGEPMRHAAAVTVAAYSPDGRYVLSGSDDRTARVWDADTGALIGAPLPHLDPVFRLSADNKGALLATGTADGTLRVWALPPLDHQARPERLSAVKRELFVQDFSAVVVPVQANGPAPRQALHLVDVVSGRDLGAELDFSAVGPLPGEERPRDLLFALSRSANVMVFDLGKALRVMDLTTGRLRFPPIEHSGPPVLRSALTADGTRTFGVSAESVRVWSTDTGALVTTLPSPGAIAGLALSRDGARLALLMADRGTVRVLETRTGKVIGEPITTPDLIRCVEFSPDGRLLATGSSEGSVRFWDAGTGKPVGPAVAHQGEVFQLAFALDGGALATLCVPVGTEVGNARLVPVPTPLTGDPVEIGQRIRTRLGKELDRSGIVRLVDIPEVKP
jgi:WD40 repeat protein